MHQKLIPNPFCILVNNAKQYVLVYHPYVTRMYSYVIRILLVCMYSYVSRMHSYVIRMYSYAIRMSLVCTRMSSVCRSYVIRMSLLCHPYVTRMLSVCHSYVVLPWTQFYSLFDESRFSNTCTTIELKELNWLCKHVKNIRSDRPCISMNFCTEFSKAQVFPCVCC